MTETLHKGKILALVLLPLAGTVAAMVLLWEQYFSMRDFWILLGMYVVTTMGVTIGYHRMLTHNGFQAPEWLRGLFLACGAMAYEGQPIAWTTTHIVHHAHSDEEGDPHSPIDGFWHAHLGWLLSLKNFPDPKVVAPHLLEDRTAVLIDRLVPLWMTLALLFPFLLGGWTGLLWGGAVRIFLTTHMTWSVNSICHTFGNRPFITTDESRNNWLIGILGFGEGWHNNHHAFPQNAFHGIHWWQIDGSGLVIRLLECLGLVWKVERVSSETLAMQKGRNQTMMETLTLMRQELTTKLLAAKGELQRKIDAMVHASMNEESIQMSIHACEEAASRLDTIQKRVLLAKNLRKRKILAYQQEIVNLLASTQQRMSPSTQYLKIS